MITGKARQKISRILRGLHTSLLRMKGMDIGKHVFIARNARMDNVNPKGIHIGECSHIFSYAAVDAHEYFSGRGNLETYIGHHTIIGGYSVVLSGVKIGNHCLVAAGSVVTKNVPDHCLVAGNPARIIKEGIEINDKGLIVNKGQRVSPKITTTAQE